MSEPAVRGDPDLAGPAATNETNPFAWASARSRVRWSVELGPGVSAIAAVWLGALGVAALARMAWVMARAMSLIVAQSCNLGRSLTHSCVGGGFAILSSDVIADV